MPDEDEEETIHVKTKIVTSGGENPCDVDDLMCQFGVMGHLQGMEKLLGSETFKASYPEFVGLEATVTERIALQDQTIKEALEKCGRSQEREE